MVIEVLVCEQALPQRQRERTRKVEELVPRCYDSISKSCQLLFPGDAVSIAFMVTKLTVISLACFGGKTPDSILLTNSTLYGTLKY